jgi:predicted Zn-dependent peptidase
LTGFKHKVYYYGPRKYETLVQTLKKEHITPANLNNYPVAKKYEKVNPKENTIYFVNYDMVQAEIGMTRWGQEFSPALMPKVKAFNEYYGGGMGSIVFQDIRESKALAYSAFSSYRTPDKKEDPFSTIFYVGTQADKLPLALDAMNNLLNNMPESEKLWNIGKKSIKQGYESKRITKEGILFNYQNALRLGINYDIRKDIYNQIDKITLGDIKTFEEQNFKNKNWNIKLLGSKDKINLGDLKKYGKVVELSMKDIFGYDVEQVLKP